MRRYHSGDEVRHYNDDKRLSRTCWMPRRTTPEPYYLLEYNGVPFSTLGGIQAISGQKKNGKTFLLAQLMAAVLEVPALSEQGQRSVFQDCEFPDRTIEYLGHLPTVLYVDTEMEKLNSAKVLDECIGCAVGRLIFPASVFTSCGCVLSPT